MSGEGFVSRWSRLKRAPAPPTEPVPKPVPEPAVVEPTVDQPPDETGPAEPVACDPASLPSLDELTAESDITPFLRPGVPVGLRGAALRRLWTLDPAIRDYIGPADYAWDFNAEGGVPGFSTTLVGDIEKLLAQAIGRPLPGADEVPDDVATPIAVAPEPVPEVTAFDTPPAVPTEEATPEPTPARPRHGSAVPI